MLLILLLLVPMIGVFTMFISTIVYEKSSALNLKYSKVIALTASIINLFISLIVFIVFNFSSNQFQFVQEYHNISNFDLYLGVDGLSVYFVILTTIIMPISLLSNWSSISENVTAYLIIILLLETLLLAIFTVLDMFLFYIFFESILPPLFLLIGIFGSSNRVRAGFYLFLYTLLGSLFMLLSILHMSYKTGNTDFDAIYKTNFDLYLQVILFIGIFIAFAVKTPTIFLNTWLLKAHVESPLGGSIILAGIVLKLSLYGIFRLILALLPQANACSTYVVYTIGVITILYASLSTLRTIDVKELIAYSSVSHAAVYLLGVFSNTVQGIAGGIILGLAHGFVSSGLFICAGGALYDRSSTRLITVYRGMAQIMPLFSILFFILCLGNAGTPLSLNFIGEFLSLYGTFERLTMAGVFASSSIVFSAAYTMYMFNRIAFGGPFTKFFMSNMPDLGKREFYILFSLAMFTVILGVYPSPVMDGLNYSVSLLLYDAPALSFSNDTYILLLLPVTGKNYLKTKLQLVRYKLLSWNFWISTVITVIAGLIVRIILVRLTEDVSILGYPSVGLPYFFFMGAFRFMLNKVLDMRTFHKSNGYLWRSNWVNVVLLELRTGSFWSTCLLGAVIGFTLRYAAIGVEGCNIIENFIALTSLIISTDMSRALAHLIINSFWGDSISVGCYSAIWPSKVAEVSNGKVGYAMEDGSKKRPASPSMTDDGSRKRPTTRSMTGSLPTSRGSVVAPPVTANPRVDSPGSSNSTVNSTNGSNSAVNSAGNLTSPVNPSVDSDTAGFTDPMFPFLNDTLIKYIRIRTTFVPTNSWDLPASHRSRTRTVALTPSSVGGTNVAGTTPSNGNITAESSTSSSSTVQPAYNSGVNSAQNQSHNTANVGNSNVNHVPVPQGVGTLVGNDHPSRLPSQLMPGPVPSNPTPNYQRLLNDFAEGRAPLNPPFVQTSADFRNTYVGYRDNIPRRPDPVYGWDWNNSSYDSKSSPYGNGKK